MYVPRKTEVYIYKYIHKCAREFHTKLFILSRKQKMKQMFILSK